MKIIHIIPSLNSGGAETMLYKLIKYKSSEIDVEIITLLSAGFYAENLKKMNIPVHELNIKKTKNPIKSLTQFLRILRKADIVQSWMYHSNLLSLVFGKILLKKKVIWGIRRSYLEKERMKKGTYYLAKVGAFFSKHIDIIISCTIIGKESHENIGYKNKNFLVISNGFDLSEFGNAKKNKFEPNRKAILLHVARWEPLKDHKTLLEAARDLKGKNIQFLLKLVGQGISEENIELMDLIDKYGLKNDVELLGIRMDIPNLMAEADIYLSSSISEGFPNVIGEAMASELYCVATDAGDTRYIIGDYGTIVPTKNSRKLAQGILDTINMDKNLLDKLTTQAREHIGKEFSIRNVVIQYEEVYKELNKSMINR